MSDERTTFTQPPTDEQIRDVFALQLAREAELWGDHTRDFAESSWVLPAETWPDV